MSQIWLLQLQAGFYISIFNKCKIQETCILQSTEVNKFMGWNNKRSVLQSRRLKVQQRLHFSWHIEKDQRNARHAPWAMQKGWGSVYKDTSTAKTKFCKIFIFGNRTLIWCREKEGRIKTFLKLKYSNQWTM